MSSGIIGRLFGNRQGQGGTYQAVDGETHNPYNNTPSTPLSNLPGHFPSDDENAQQNSNSHFARARNYLNSVAVNHSFRSLSGWIQYLLFRPVILILILCFRVLAQLLSVIYFKDKQSVRSRSLSGTTTSNNLINDPIDRVSRFVRVLEDNITPQSHYNQSHIPIISNTLPPFFEASYTQALYMCHQRAKFLFVYLTHPQNENSSNIFNKIITNPEFITICDSSNVIIWGGDLTNPETYQLANSLNVTKFPFLGLLCLTRTTTMTPRGPSKTSPKVSLISKIQGSFSDDQDPSVLIKNKFKKRIAKYETELGLIRAELRDKFMSQAILKQQDLNYQNALAKDRLKKQEKERSKLKKKYLAWKVNYFENLKSNSEPGSARVAIKLQNGNRVTFHFPPEAPVQDIFTYVELLNGGYFEGKIDTSINEEEAQQHDFEHFKVDYKFKLSSPLPPKRNLNELLSQNTKVKDIDCVYPNGLLIVEDL